LALDLGVRPHQGENKRSVGSADVHHQGRVAEVEQPDGVLDDQAGHV
jgi:hypothetical protein